MNSVAPAPSRSTSARKPTTIVILLAMVALGSGAAFPGFALDLVGITGITGPPSSALSQIAALGPGI